LPAVVLIFYQVLPLQLSRNIVGQVPIGKPNDRDII